MNILDALPIKLSGIILDDWFKSFGFEFTSSRNDGNLRTYRSIEARGFIASFIDMESMNNGETFQAKKWLNNKTKK